jgi:hypothetical protein
MALLLSPLLLFNVLLQPAQAQTTLTFSTSQPAFGGGYLLTFEAQGNASSSDSQSASITNGTFQITNSSSHQTLVSGDFNSGTFTNNTEGGSIVATGSVDQSQGGSSKLSTSCSTLCYNGITVDIRASTWGDLMHFKVQLNVLLLKDEVLHNL